MAMKCAKCGTELEVRGSKSLDDTKIRRKKICPNCGYFIWTIELPMSEYEDMASFVNGFVNLLTKYTQKPQ